MSQLRSKRTRKTIDYSKVHAGIEIEENTQEERRQLQEASKGKTKGRAMSKRRQRIEGDPRETGQGWQNKEVTTTIPGQLEAGVASSHSPQKGQGQNSEESSQESGGEQDGHISQQK